jgi:hypothetical protein
VFLYVAAASAAKAMATANPNSNFGFRIGFGLGGLSNLLVLAVVWLVVGGIAYLGFRRRGGVTFTQAIFTWPVIGVTAIMGLLFIFASSAPVLSIHASA